VIKWLENNPLGITLLSICGGLLLVSLLLAVVRSLPPSVSSTGSGGQDAALELDVPELDDNEPLDAYTVITERPVFNESRQPAIEEGAADEDQEDLLAEEDVDAPELELSGVIITPSIRMVTLRGKDLTESLVAFEGQPLRGNFGSWQVSRIGPRDITLSSESGEEVQLKLQVHDVKIAEPPKIETAATEPSSGPGAEGADGESDQPLSRAEEIRQRIAQRREELRRAAEENAENQESQPQKPDYRQAIQTMISGKKQDQEENGNQK